MNRTLLIVAIAACLVLIGGDVVAAVRGADDIGDASAAVPWYQFILDFFTSATGCAGCHME